jgi:hypothetical protein
MYYGHYIGVCVECQLRSVRWTVYCYNSGHGLEDDACCGMRCVWAPVDTGDQEKALELSFKELPFHVVG